MQLAEHEIETMSLPFRPLVPTEDCWDSPKEVVPPRRKPAERPVEKKNFECISGSIGKGRKLSPVCNEGTILSHRERASFIGLNFPKQFPKAKGQSRNGYLHL
ncbi:hypothetical protein CEXT_806161 [Caerostris extrusa]|uniref:Uncharacterized protein n=1 Tax=Caerostris extrusa TaxID=172846 RepID=A0AAV4RDF6_CAEEX|nr:hypothetical protein CEXT_806161 [Caerostris extrusa]